MATARQIKLIYVLAGKQGLVERGNDNDNLHNIVYQTTGIEHVSKLTDEQATDVIARLQEVVPDNADAYISELQIKKIFGMMYELSKISPSTATVKERLCGIINKTLDINVNPKADIFKGFSERQGAALIEALKRYIRSAKRKGRKADG